MSGAVPTPGSPRPADRERAKGSPRRRIEVLIAAVERYAGLVFLAAGCLGLLLPGLAATPRAAPLVPLAAVIFLASSRVDGAALRAVAPLRLLGVYLLRFVLLPAGVYAAAGAAIPDRARALLLLAALPPAVSSPGLVAIQGGNVAAALVLLAGATILSPLVLPGLLSSLAGRTVELDHRSLAATLAGTVLLPIALHLPLRATLRARVAPALGSLSVLLVAASVTLVVGQRRATLLAAPERLPGHLAWTLAAYALFFGAGLALAPRGPERRWLPVCSGANNIVLGASLAVAYLTPDEAAFTLMGLVPWSLGLLLLPRGGLGHAG